MSQFVTTFFIDEFTSGVEHLAQQDGSRIRSQVRMETVSSERQSFDQLGVTSMNERTSRHSDTEYDDTPHDRRWVIPRPYDVADLVDVPDKIRVLNDPTNEYTRSFGMAAGRNIDDVLIAAFDASTLTGEDGATVTLYDTAMDVATTGTATGLTLDKMLQAKELLDANEEPDEGRTLLVAARQFRDLLSLVEVASQDFNRDRALVDGVVRGFLGFTIIRSQRMPSPLANIRTCFYWQRTGMLLGEAQSPRGTIDRLPTKRNSIQVLYQQDLGATRMRETAVGRLYVNES